VHDEHSASAYLLDQLELSLARSELPLVAAARRALLDSPAPVQRLATLNDWVLRTRESSESRQQALQMGRSLVEWMRQQHGDADARLIAVRSLPPAPTWPVAFALASVLAEAPTPQALLAFAFSWAENMVQAAVKALPLGQSAGQRLLRALVQAIPNAVEAAQLRDDGTRQNFAPMLAIRAAQHETQYSRLFRS
jgi:urease accessory protein